MQDYSSFQQIVFIIILINVAFSMIAFGNIQYFEKMKFHISDILTKNQYYRLLSSAFIHGDYIHLFFNMYVLYSFSFALERYISIPVYLLVYFASLLIGNLLPLFIHKNKPNYSAVGASGAVSGVLYASIYFNPFGELLIYFIPMTNWIFAILYLIYTVYSAKKGKGRIGHDAHFGGATAGLVIAFLINPAIGFENALIILAMFAPFVYFIYDIFTREKQQLFVKNETSSYSNRSVDDLYNFNKATKNKELNELLEKVNKKGLNNLSSYERERLDKLSNDIK